MSVNLPDIPAEYDIASTIRNGLALLHEPGSVFEIRALGCRRKDFQFTAAGYFDDFQAAAEAIARLDAELTPAGVYVTLNPVMPDLLARAANRFVERLKHATTDAEILRRRWLLFDLDPDRASGIMATSGERQGACRFAADLEDELQPFGLGTPIIASSGSGFYLLYRLDLPNTEEATALVKSIYAAAIGRTAELAAFHQTKIDAATFNAARIIRVGGTWNRKGDSTPERPHRLAEIYHPEAGTWT